MYIYIWHFYSIEQTNTSQAIHITISFPWLRFKWDHAFTPPKKTSNQMGRERDIQVTGEGRPASAKLIWQPPQRRSTSPARDLGKGMSCVHGRGWGWWCWLGMSVDPWSRPTSLLRCFRSCLTQSPDANFCIKKLKFCMFYYFNLSNCEKN